MFGSQSSSFVRLRLADPNRLSNFPIARFQFLLKQAEAEYAKLYYLSQLHNLLDRLVFEGVAIGSRVVTLYLQHLGYKSFSGRPSILTTRFRDSAIFASIPE